MNKVKIASGIIAAVAVSAIGSGVAAEEYCDTLKYIIRDDKAIITGYKGNPKSIVIPAKIDGKEVVEIRENAFFKCESLKEISFPQSVLFIGHHAFFECTSLQSAELSDNIYSIGEGSFSGCISLSDINMPKNLKVIENNSFYNCINMSELEFTNSIEEIGAYAFANCRKIDEVEFGGRLRNIGDYAFYGCGQLSCVYIPESVMNIGSCALGFDSKSMKINKDFRLLGKESSIGKIYAKSNNIKYDSTENKKSVRKISKLPAIAMIFSGSALLILKSISKIDRLKKIIQGLICMNKN